MKIESPRIIPLEHRASFLDYGRAGRAVLASREGDASIVDLPTAAAHRLPRLGPIKGVAIDPQGERIAAVDSESGGLKMFTASGGLLSEYFSGSQRKKLFVQTCRFAASADRLLAVAAVDDGVLVELLQTDRAGGHRWTLVNSVVVELPFVDSWCILSDTSDANLFSMYNGGGQDGQIVHWLDISGGKLACNPKNHLHNTMPPTFVDGGKEYFAIDAHGLHRFEFPSSTPNGTCTIDDPNDPDSYFSTSFCLLHDQLALVTVNDEIYRLCDTRNMTLGEELILDGYSDLSLFRRMGDDVVFVRRRDGGTSLDGWQDELLLVPANEIG